MVTHGIEEAVLMADRIIVLSRNPARVVADLPVVLPRPRNRKHPQFLAVVDRIYKIVSEADNLPKDEPITHAGPGLAATDARTHLTPLPHAPIGMLTGLLELVSDRGGRDDLYHLGSELLMEVDDLLPVTDAAELLQFATVREGDLQLTPLGQRFADADILERKELFAAQIRDLALFALILRVLQNKRNRAMNREFFADLLAEEFSDPEVQAQLQTAVAWGRYAELFAYDQASEMFHLEDPEEGADDDGDAPSSEEDPEG
jgi:NitT/TauT family transport system ATP-binding protein